jgi:hypothetical protein
METKEYVYLWVLDFNDGQVYKYAIDKAVYNVLAVALDHMYEHLNDLVGDFDTFEEENINLKRIVDVQSLKEMFNL